MGVDLKGGALELTLSELSTLCALNSSYDGRNLYEMWQSLSGGSSIDQRREEIRAVAPPTAPKHNRKEEWEFEEMEAGRNTPDERENGNDEDLYRSRPSIDLSDDEEFNKEFPI